MIGILGTFKIVRIAHNGFYKLALQSKPKKFGGEFGYEFIGISLCTKPPCESNQFPAKGFSICIKLGQRITGIDFQFQSFKSSYYSGGDR